MKKYTLAAIVAAILAAQGVMAQPPRGEMGAPREGGKGQPPMMDCKMKCGPMQDGGPGMRGGASGMGMLMRLCHDPELQKQAGISDDEVAKLKFLATKVKKDMIDLKANMEKAQLDLQAATDIKDPSREAVMAAADAVAAAQAAMMKANLSVKFDVIGLIGADKADALQKACSEHRMDLRKREGKDRDGKMWKGKKDGKGRGPKGVCPQDDDKDDDDDKGEKEDKD
ncbi:MAG: hypothetical protein AB7T27_06575 [Kiritimatiellia bacterium]